MTVFSIRPLEGQDREQLTHFMVEHWGAPIVVVHGKTYNIDSLPGFVAIEDGHWIGVVSYQLQGQACEIVSLDSLQESCGIGTALINAVIEEARAAACRRLWLITTNDNLHALRFYQKRGFVLVTIHRNAVIEARKIKPQIPLLGNDDIPLRDEIELELLFDV